MLLCKNAYASRVCPAWTKKMTTASLAQSTSFFVQWTVLAEGKWNISLKSNGTFMNFKLDTGRQAGVGREIQILSWR